MEYLAFLKFHRWLDTLRPRAEHFEHYWSGRPLRAHESEAPSLVMPSVVPEFSTPDMVRISLPPSQPPNPRVLPLQTPDGSRSVHPHLSMRFVVAREVVKSITPDATANPHHQAEELSDTKTQMEEDQMAQPERLSDPEPSQRDPRYWKGLAWLQEHMAALNEKYKNKWIVVVDSQVVHEATNQRDARSHVRKHDLGWVAVIWHMKGYMSV